MKHWLLAASFIVLAVLLLAFTNIRSMFSDVETKGPTEITEWVKLAVSIVSLLVGIVNLRLALVKKSE